MSFIQSILSLLPSVTVVESLMTYVCLLLLSIMFNINIYVVYIIIESLDLVSFEINLLF